MDLVGQLIAKDSILRRKTVASRHSTRKSAMAGIVTNTLCYGDSLDLLGEMRVR